MISNEHPEALERLRPAEDLKPRVRDAVKQAKAAHKMTVTSDAGSDLVIDIADCPVAGVWGWTDRPGTVTHWPGGILVAFPGRNAVNGRLVMKPVRSGPAPGSPGGSGDGWRTPAPPYRR